jgi:hypothetical protein
MQRACVDRLCRHTATRVHKSTSYRSTIFIAMKGLLGTSHNIEASGGVRSTCSVTETSSLLAKFFR